MQSIPLVALLRKPLDLSSLAALVERPSAGAVVTFVGTTRNRHEGRPVRYLEYEAQEALARKELERLCAEAREKWEIAEAGVWHRLGKVEIGETSVAIAVSAAHRAPAFDACRFLIDTLKRTVPVFKKEYFADGGDAVWVGPDGKPVAL